MQVQQFFQFLKVSRLDAAVWMVTFLTVVIVSIDIGLLVGIICSLSCIFIRGMKPYTCLLGHIPKTDLYLDIKRYRAVSVDGQKDCREFSLNSSRSLSGRGIKRNQNIPLLRQFEFRQSWILQVGTVQIDWSGFGNGNPDQHESSHFFGMLTPSMAVLPSNITTRLFSLSEIRSNLLEMFDYRFLRTQLH